MLIDNDFPLLLGAELHRPHPSYVAELAIEPVVVHDFNAQRGQTVQLDRYRFWGNAGSKESRERTPEQTIGTANSRNIIKDKVTVTLREYTGPADPSDPLAPSTFKVAKETLITAQRLLLDTKNLAVFHQSIGSLTLLDDYRRWRDRVFINELLKCEAKGQSSDTQGGYYNPNGLTDAALTATGYVNNEDCKFDVKDDLLTIVKSLRKRNTPSYIDGNYRCLADPTFLMHLRRDSAFREVARYSGLGQVNPLQGYMQPNAALYMGQGYGQATFVAGEPTLPVGFVFEGVRFFESTNMPQLTKTVNINATPKACEAPLGIFFGPQCVGVGIGGPNASVVMNQNDDFSRFVILIWQLFAGFEILNPDFATSARTYVA